jgi:catalase
MEKKKLTTASGRPYDEFENSMTVGNRGPILLHDITQYTKAKIFSETCKQTKMFAPFSQVLKLNIRYGKNT